MGKLTWFDSHNAVEPQAPFPPSSYALKEPNGLLAVGGDLSPSRLLQAYRQGIFPWYEEGQPILWWTPDPRMVLFPDECHLSRSLQKLLRQNRFHLTADRVFPEVIDNCAAPRGGIPGTWITPEMRAAYIALHETGYAHSIEVWEADELVGGLYGVAQGAIFFGESMFSRRPNTSKVAFASLAQTLHHWGYRLLDCQVASPHLFSLGAREISRTEFEAILAEAIPAADAKPVSAGPQSWQETWPPHYQCRR